MRLLTQIIAFYAIWFAAVLGAGHGYELEGTAAAVVLNLLSFYREIKFSGNLIGKLCFIGIVIDYLAFKLGAIGFPGQYITLLGYPCWMITLWLAFACMYVIAMQKIAKSFLLSVVFGAIGGPVSYYAAERLGGISVSGQQGYIIISIEYVCVMLIWAKAVRRRKA